MANELLVSRVSYKGVERGTSTLTINDTSVPLIVNLAFWLNGGTVYPDGNWSPRFNEDYEARLYVSEGGIDDWNVWFRIDNGSGIVEITKVSRESNYIKLRVRFGRNDGPFRLSIYATHVPSGQDKLGHAGVILPNTLRATIPMSGLFQGTYRAMEAMKAAYPKWNPVFGKVDLIVITVPVGLVMAGFFNKMEDHWDPKKVPLIFTDDFASNQNFELRVAGALIGAGGWGGEAGYTYVEGFVKYKWPTDGLTGGNPVYVERSDGLRTVSVVIEDTGYFEAGGGGGGAGTYTDPGVGKEWYQWGLPGAGGMPNGRNGLPSPRARKYTTGTNPVQVSDLRPRTPQFDVVGTRIRMMYGCSGYTDIAENANAYIQMHGGRGGRPTGYYLDTVSGATLPNKSTGYFDVPFNSPGVSYAPRTNGGTPGNRTPNGVTIVKEQTVDRRTGALFFTDAGTFWVTETTYENWETTRALLDY